MKVCIEIDLNELIQTKKQKSVPIVETLHDDQSMESGALWFREFKNGEDRWFRIEGRGENPLNCTNIIFRSSPGNLDVLDDEITGYHPKYGNVVFSDFSSNMYVQSVKLDQLIDLGYKESRTNFPELVE